MKILSTEQIKALDQFTIENEPILSIDLMERAARTCVNRILKLTEPDTPIWIVCGKGNNGGDGLAIARLLNDQGISAKALLIDYTPNFSADAETNYERLKEKYPNQLITIRSLENFQQQALMEETLLIDALLGTGTNRSASGLLEEVINYINAHFTQIISIDVPSGLYGDSSSTENKSIIRSRLTLSFQQPKLAFLFSENQNFVPEFELLDIGLRGADLPLFPTNFYYTTQTEISSLLKPRSKFSHKGTFGHALLLAGSKGKSGAAIIASKACLRSGAGLLTVHSNKETLRGILNHLPEAMSREDLHPDYITEIEHPEKYSTIGFGPGTGTAEETQTTLKKILHYYKGKLVIDADGLTILAENKTWLNFLPPNTILTPHPKEFERLTQKHADDFEQLKAAKHFVLTYKCILILKGAHSAVVMPDGTVFFNSSGNAGLAKGDSGDALTGIILGLLSRGYNAPQSALIGTFVHGFAADLCARKKSKESILITDVIEQLPRAFKKLEAGR